MIVEPKATPPRRARRSRPEESGRVPLSREMVLARAIEVGDRDGLEAVSFRRLASDMNVTPMALYRYVRDKDDLLDAMSDIIVGRVDLASVVGAPGGWEVKLRVFLDGLRNALQAHPVAITLFTRRASTTPNWLRTIEVGLGILREAGFPMREAVDVLRQINNRLAGLVTAEPVAAPSPSPDQDAAVRQSRAILQSLPPAEFHNVIEAAPYLIQCDDPGRYYELGLDMLIDGVRAQLVKSCQSSTSR